MKDSVKITIVVVLLLVVLALVFRKKIARLFRKPATNRQIAEKSSIIAKLAPAPAPMNIIAEPKPAAEAEKPETDESKVEETAKVAEPEKPAEKPTEDAELAYDEETMIIRAYGKIYRIPDAESMSNIQRSLIEGFKYLSDGTAAYSNPLNPICIAGKVVKECVDSAALGKYARLVDDMVEADTSIQKNGITGKLNLPTAVAFAETVKIMPSVIEKYRVA